MLQEHAKQVFIPTSHATACLWLAVETTIFRRERDEQEGFFERDFDRTEAPPDPRRPTLISQAFAALRRARDRQEEDDSRRRALEEQELDEDIARLFASDDDNEELVAHDNYEQVDLPELEERPPISSEGGLSAYF